MWFSPMTIAFKSAQTKFVYLFLLSNWFPFRVSILNQIKICLTICRKWNRKGRLISGFQPTLRIARHIALPAEAMSPAWMFVQADCSAITDGKGVTQSLTCTVSAFEPFHYRAKSFHLLITFRLFDFMIDKTSSMSRNMKSSDRVTSANCVTTTRSVLSRSLLRL